MPQLMLSWGYRVVRAGDRLRARSGRITYLRWTLRRPSGTYCLAIRSPQASDWPTPPLVSRIVTASGIASPRAIGAAVRLLARCSGPYNGGVAEVVPRCGCGRSARWLTHQRARTVAFGARCGLAAGVRTTSMASRPRSRRSSGTHCLAALAAQAGDWPANPASVSNSYREGYRIRPGRPVRRSDCGRSTR
jgi:hypothetical protein